MWVTPDSNSSCSESAAADTSAGKEHCMRRWGIFPSGGGVGGGRFTARTVAVRSYPLSGVPPFTLVLTATFPLRTSASQLLRGCVGLELCVSYRQWVFTVQWVVGGRGPCWPATWWPERTTPRTRPSTRHGEDDQDQLRLADRNKL